MRLLPQILLPMAAIGFVCLVMAAPVGATTTVAERQVKTLNTKLHKSQTVVRWYNGKGRWTLHPHYAKCLAIPSAQREHICRIARRNLNWHAGRIERIERTIQRLREQLLRASNSPTAVRAWVTKYHPCLAGIIAGENAAYDPTLDFGGGHGNVREAYGIPQALPGTKMASAGPDWRTNPWTQIRWMISYVARWGGECGALAQKRATGWY